MKKIVTSGVILSSVAVLLAGCGRTASGTAAESSAAPAQETATEAAAETEEKTEKQTAQKDSEQVAAEYPDATRIVLSDDKITVDGEEAGTGETEAVYLAHDIVYYEDGKDFTYGEGTEADAHTKEEADAHTVVHITKPGTYLLSGSLSAGQIAVDLGEGAKEDPEAVVTLVLGNVDLTCTVAPAVIFYQVYECSSSEEADATKDVDTVGAGANVIIADGTVNRINGSYVAKIYKSYELNEAGTEVTDSKKLHKYDGAFYSKMSMNVDGGEEDSGILNIQAENEGLDSELHLTINGGNINITSGNDGINTNEDGISVTTINGGRLNIVVDGSTGEGDGIDSNGWLVINGGTVISSACAFSGDAGIDSDNGIHINGGTVIASGNMLDRISESEQNFLVLSFDERQDGGTSYLIKDENGEVLEEWEPVNDFTYLIYSSADLEEGDYTIWQGETQLAGAAGEAMGGPGRGGMGGLMGRPDGEEPPKRPDGAEAPEKPDDAKGQERPDGTQRGERPDRPKDGNGGGAGKANESASVENTEVSGEFAVAEGGSYFSHVRASE
ncbi:MAG: carbohydrate-binding domain-containing protein [Otoolea sp.]